VMCALGCAYLKQFNLAAQASPIRLSQSAIPAAQV
jgi:hypothetical protein